MADTNSDFSPVVASIELNTAGAIQSAFDFMNAGKQIDDTIQSVSNTIDQATSYLGGLAAQMRDFSDDATSLNNILNGVDATSSDLFSHSVEGWGAIGKSIQEDIDYLNNFQKAAENAKMAAQQTEGAIPTASGISAKYGLPNGDISNGDNGGGNSGNSGGDSGDILSQIGGRGFSTAGSLARDLGLGEIGKGIADLGKVITSARLVDRLAEAAGGFEGLVGFIAPLIPLLIVGAGAWYELGQEVQAGNQLLEDAKNSVDAYYKAVSNGTSDSIQKQIDQLDQQKAIADQKAQDIQNALNSGFGGAQAQFGDLGARLLFAAQGAGAFGGGLKDTQKDLEDAKKSAKDFQDQIDGLNRAADSGAVALNTFQDALQKSIAWEIQRNELIQSGTAKQIDSLIAKNQIEQKAYQDAIDQENAEYKKLNDTHQLTAIAITNIKEKTDEYQAKLDDLKSHYADLTGEVLRAAQANDVFKTAIQGEGDVLLATAKALGDLSKLNEATADDRMKSDVQYADAQSKAWQSYLDGQSKAQTAFNDKQAKEKSNFSDQLSDQDNKQAEKKASEEQKLNQAYLDSADKTNKEVIKYRTELADKETAINQTLSDKLQIIATDLANKISDIQDKARNDELDAASKLDARRIVEIQRKEAQDIDKANKDATTKEVTDQKDAEKQKAKLEQETELKITELQKSSEAQRELAFQQGTQKIQDEQDQYAKERADKIVDFGKRLDDEKKAFDDARDLAFAKHLEALDNLKKKYDEQQTVINQKYDDQKALIQQKLDDQKSLISGKLDEHKTLIGQKLDDQKVLYATLFDGMKSTQTSEQNLMSASWTAWLAGLKASIPGGSTSTSTSTYTGASNSGEFAPSTTPSYAGAYNSGEYTPTAPSYGGAVDTGASAAQINAGLQSLFGVLGAPTIDASGKITPNTSTAGGYGGTNFNDFAGYIPGHAGGLDRVPRDNYIASLHADEKILNKQEADDYRGGKTGDRTINFHSGAIQVNGSNLSRDELREVFNEALEDKLKEAIGE